MPLQNTGAISAAQIQAEFGGTGQVSMNQYYRGAGNVPNDVFCHNNTIPANGAISFNDFYNTTKGDTYYNYTASFTLSPLPANTRRIQVWLLGGGGGGAGRRRSVARSVLYARAGGGGGGYSAADTINAIRDNDEYVTGEVGAGGAASAGTGDGASIGGSGGTSIVRVRNSRGGIIRSSDSAQGGGGGTARTTTTGSTGGTGGARGIGTTANGGAGGGSGNAQGTSGGGAAGSAAIGDGGTGGSGTASFNPTANPGIRGRIRIRI